ncbi:flagellar biosynthesis protein FlhF [Lachnospira pectinoschiza]|uniref:Flagellar biosynthesis protein FlhF n=1 Tax=Lachnospira pectinoschiza TaxID=28052 RepID=A0A1G9ZAZ3_9FIRM|nr:flagellar biosynthesis protein FlhF [Lachnospira pectinoschiza]SDN18011.1 flagellar biosynthesis protein FlhF [Lachnospira pectinoschiza]
MIVKKFQAPTENEAMKKAKEELGANAVVLNIKFLKARGLFRIFKKDQVEITAALEEKEFIKNVNTRKPEMKTIDFKEDKPDENASNTVDPKKSNDTASLDLRADEDIDLNDPKRIEERLDALQKLMKESSANNQKLRQDNRFDSKNRKSEIYRNPDIIYEDEEEKKNTKLEAKTEAKLEAKTEAKTETKTLEAEQTKTSSKENSSNDTFLKLIHKKLVDSEVDEKYVDEILGEIALSMQKESDIDSILSAVYQKIILKLGEASPVKLNSKPKLAFFIGPTGVGKTTTIAKIASKFKLENYAKVAFITSDTYRIAAVEQLNTYASIIDCPVDVVYGPEELRESLESFKNYDLVLVDTAGRSHKSEEQMEELKRLLEVATDYKEDYDLDIYLTLSVTTKYKDLVNIAKKYDDIKGWKIIFTKLDETCSLGNIINVKMLTNAPLSYTTSGQNVPNDIELINEQFIAKQLLGGNT